MRINDYWREGKYIDLWSSVHVLSGIVVGALLFNFGVDFRWSLIIALVLFIGWEVFEILVDIKEHMSNMVTDVACDLVGFFFVSYYYFVLLKPFSWQTTFIYIGIFLLMELWGFLAYEKRKLSA